mmetsp:Transcript_40000/g.43370  ORF Transcript_40000/g.43370 Transcript_40000/m.43370 type:complete len:183 (-) Transcript_40000:705-1253(-)
MKHLPTVDGKFVLDVQRIKKGTGITAKQMEDEHNQSGRVHEILTGVQYQCIFGSTNNRVANETNLIKECNTLLTLFPHELDEECYNKNQDLILPQSAIYLIGSFMAEALYLSKSSLTTLHGCAAAIRLWSETHVKDMQYTMSDNFPMLVPMIIYQAIEAQNKTKIHHTHTFLSTNSNELKMN